MQNSFQKECHTLLQSAQEHGNMPHQTEVWCMIIYYFFAFFILLFRIAGKLRLSLPLLYALVVPTIFHEWYYAHQFLATGIWYGMLALVAVSWVVSLVNYFR